MNKLGDKGILKVRTNIEGTPVAIINELKSEPVIRIYEKWRSEEGDNGQSKRCYFKVRTRKGFIYDIYRDESSKQWYIGKTYL